MPAGSTTSVSSNNYSRAKTVVALTVVVGCFAILWPKIFYPMLTASLPGSSPGGAAPVRGAGHLEGDMCCDVINEKDVHAYKLMNEICAQIIEQEATRPKEPPMPKVQVPDSKKVDENHTKIEQPTPTPAPRDPKIPKWRKTLPPEPEDLSPNGRCRAEILKRCEVDVDVLLKDHSVISKEYKEAIAKLRSFNTSKCLRDNFGVHLEIIGLERVFKNPEATPSYMKQERSTHQSDNFVHPALREKGSAIPQTLNQPRRTLDLEARPGPQPGIRPPMGHGAHYSPQSAKGGPGGGTMGIIMPLYTIGIVVFFLYTIFRILFRKSDEKEQPLQPKLLKELGKVPGAEAVARSSGYGSYETAASNNHDNHAASSITQAHGRRCSTEEYYGGRRRSSAGIAPIPTIPIVQDISKPCQMAPIGLSRAVSDIYECPTPEPGGAPYDDQVVALEQELDTGEREQDARDVEIDMLRKRLEETEAAMERIVAQMGSATNRLSPTILAQVLQAQGVAPPKAKEEAESEAAQINNKPTTKIAAKSKKSLSTQNQNQGNKENEQPSGLQLQLTDSDAFVKFVQDLSQLILKQSIETASAALAFESRKIPNTTKSAPNLTPTDKVSVVGMVERAGLENGQKWTDRSSTPTFQQGLRQSPIPPQSPRVLTPPIAESTEIIPNIYLEGPIPPSSDQLMVADSTAEEMVEDEYDYEDEDEDYDSEIEKPVVLSGKVTLSMFSSTGTGTSVTGGLVSGDETTEAPSFSLDDHYHAPAIDANTRNLQLTAAKEQELADALASAINDENGASGVNNASSTNASSPNMDEYELIGKGGGSNGDEGEDEDIEHTHYTTADAEAYGGQMNAGEETAADISAIEEMKHGDGDNEDLLDDEEEEEEEDEEYDEEEEEEELGSSSEAEEGDEDNEEDEDVDEAAANANAQQLQEKSSKQVPDKSKGGLAGSFNSLPTSPASSSSRSPLCASPNGTFFTEP